jgi:hypothetical protein
MRLYRCATNGRFSPPVPSQEMTRIIGIFRGQNTLLFGTMSQLLESVPRTIGQGELDRCRSRSEYDNLARILTGSVGRPDRE